MQSTLGFAPTDDDLDEGYFDLPVITTVAAPPPDDPRTGGVPPAAVARLTHPVDRSRLRR